MIHKKYSIGFSEYIKEKSLLLLKMNRSKSLSSLKNTPVKSLPSFLSEYSGNESIITSINHQQPIKKERKQQSMSDNRVITSTFESSIFEENYDTEEDHHNELQNCPSFKQMKQLKWFKKELFPVKYVNQWNESSREKSQYKERMSQNLISEFNCSQGKESQSKVQLPPLESQRSIKEQTQMEFDKTLQIHKQNIYFIKKGGPDKSISPPRLANQSSRIDKIQLISSNSKNSNKLLKTGKQFQAMTDQKLRSISSLFQHSLIKESQNNQTKSNLPNKIPIQAIEQTPTASQSQIFTPSSTHLKEVTSPRDKQNENSELTNFLYQKQVSQLFGRRQSMKNNLSTQNSIQNDRRQSICRRDSLSSTNRAISPSQTMNTGRQRSNSRLTFSYLVSSHTNLSQIKDRSKDFHQKDIEYTPIRKSQDSRRKSTIFKSQFTSIYSQEKKNECDEIVQLFEVMRDDCKKMIESNYPFREMIEQKLLLELSQFLFLLNTFWRFCADNLHNTNCVTSIFKISQKEIDLIEESMDQTLTTSNISFEKKKIFLESFRMHSRKNMIPTNLVEKIGGLFHAKKLLKEIINALKSDITVGIFFTQALSGEDIGSEEVDLFCHFLNGEYDKLESIITSIKSTLNLTQQEFFIIKLRISEVMSREKLMIVEDRMILLERLEKMRAYVLQDQFLLVLLKNWESLSIQFSQSAQFKSYLKARDSQFIRNIAEDTLDAIFGRQTLIEYSRNLKFKYLIDSQIPNMEAFLQSIESIVVPFILDRSESKHEAINAAEHARLKFQFLREFNLEIYSQEIKNYGSHLATSLKEWSDENFRKYIKHIEVTENENSKLEFMSSFLKLYFYRDSDVFSFFDVAIAANHFAFTQNAVEFWTVGLRCVLTEDQTLKLQLVEVERIIKGIQNILQFSKGKKFFKQQQRLTYNKVNSSAYINQAYQKSQQRLLFSQVK